MAMPVLERLLLKAKEATQEDIDGLCRGIAELLPQEDKSAECSGLLRQLFVILQASQPGAEPCIPHSLLKSMIQVLSGPPRQRNSANTSKCSLCFLMLRETFPDEGLADQLDQIGEMESFTPSMASLQLFQGKKSKCINKVLPELVRWLQSQDFRNQRQGLCLLTAVSMLHGHAIEEDMTSAASEKMAQWLSTASLLQAPNPHAINPFRKDEESRVTEIDGTPSTNFFTVLNIGQYYTEDQLLNILSFSVLYKWLLQVVAKFKDTDGEASEVSESAEVKGERLEILSSTTVKKVLGALLSKSVDYCLRIIDQCERKVKVQSDSEMQIAILVEAVTVLDLICSLDSDQTAPVFQEVKRLNSRLTQEAPKSPALIPVLKFFFHHSTSVVHDPREIFQHFFLTVVSLQFKDQGLMYDAIDFIYNNLEKVAFDTHILSSYFPNLFKILAWHPRVFLKEFVRILPAIMDFDTSVEVFHLLLDLPCMTSALEVIDKAKRSDPLVVNLESEPTSSFEAYYSPRYKPLFNYITRCESGQGDTIDRLSRLHSVLCDCVNSTRVMVCCQLVPVLLRKWFSAVLKSEDAQFLAQLLPVVLERSGLIFGVPELIQDVHKVMADELLVLCMAYPQTVTFQRADICEFLQTTANMAGRVNIYSNLIYMVGEYSSQTHCPDCTSEVIGKYYETLEVVTYELLSQIASQDHDSSVPKVLSTLMSALAKLASRSQDLIPRTILCLTKVAKQQNLIMLSPVTRDILTNRVTALIAVLKNPDSSSHILIPTPEIMTERWHLNNTSMPSILRGMQRLLKD